MKFRLFDRRVGFSVGAVGLLFATMAPALIPAFASAGTITTRSIQMSSGVPSATSSYQVTFTPATTGLTDMIIYFCSNSPLSGQACTAPTGFSLTGATVTAGTGTTGAALDSTTNDAANPGGTNHNVIAITGMTMGTSASTLTINGVTNPSASNTTFYARIQTYSSEGVQSTAYNDASNGAVNGDLDTTYTDNGSVALSTSNSLGVTAAVLESLSFCLYGDAGNVTSTTANETSDTSGYLSGTSTNVGTINSHNLDQLGALTNSTVDDQGPGANCTDTTAATYAGSPYAGAGSITPNVTLGQNVASGIYALDTSNVSYAADWSQISTNANGGATVYLKSANTCGASAGTSTGLSMNGDTSCGIPGSSGGLTAGTAGVGVALGTPVNLDASTTDDGAIALGGTYNSSPTGGTPQYALPGATSGTYGGSLYTTDSGPAANWDVPIGVGATISNNTPAGSYSDNLSLIAVGTF
jgi:hypothetical protein